MNEGANRDEQIVHLCLDPNKAGARRVSAPGPMSMSAYSNKWPCWPVSRILSASWMAKPTGRSSFIWDWRRRQPLAVYPHQSGRAALPPEGSDAAWPCTPRGLPGRPGHPRPPVGSYPTLSPITCAPRGHRLVCSLLHVPSHCL